MNRGITAIIMVSASLMLCACNRNNNATNEEAADKDTVVPETIVVEGTVIRDSEERPNIIREDSINPYDNIQAFQGADMTEFDQSEESVGVEDAFSEGDSSDDFRPSTPSFFDVMDPQEDLIGEYNRELGDRLYKELNSRRTKFGTGTLTNNPSLGVAADVRAKEYAIYPYYKLRPDDTSFTTVSPEGWVKDEYFCIPVRKDTTPEMIIDGLMQIREARNIMMNPDYKNVGVTYFEYGKYSIAGMTFGY